MRCFFLREIVSVVSLTVLSLGAGAQTAAPVQAPPNLPNPGTPSTPSLPQASSSSLPTNQVLTLADAEARALKNQPRLLAQQFRAEAANKRIIESRSGYFPQMFGNLTAVEANGDTAVAAGAVTTSSVSTRAAGGGSLVQLITDFGHTSNLVQSARFEAQAARQDEESVHQVVLMNVQEAYFAAQAAESVRKTAQAVLDFRSVTLRQLNALAQSQLRSTIDVQFAQVMVSEAELAVVRAESTAQKAQAQLAASMGEEGASNYTLVDESLPPSPDSEPSGYIQQAIVDRPDLKGLRLHSESA